jgi:hypothetical protein
MIMNLYPLSDEERFLADRLGITDQERAIVEAPWPKIRPLPGRTETCRICGRRIPEPVNASRGGRPRVYCLNPDCEERGRDDNDVREAIKDALTVLERDWRRDQVVRLLNRELVGESAIVWPLEQPETDDAVDARMISTLLLLEPAIERPIRQLPQKMRKAARLTTRKIDVPTTDGQIRPFEIFLPGDYGTRWTKITRAAKRPPNEGHAGLDGKAVEFPTWIPNARTMEQDTLAPGKSTPFERWMEDSLERSSAARYDALKRQRPAKPPIRTTSPGRYPGQPRRPGEVLDVPRYVSRVPWDWSLVAE